MRCILAGLLVLMAGLWGCEAAPGSYPNEILVLLVGGASAGAYSARSTDLACTHGLAGIDRWGSHFFDTSATARLAGFQLVVPDADGKADTPNAFFFGLTLGHFPTDARYEIETRRNAARRSGTGTVRMGQEGGVRTFTLDGTVGDSIRIVATIRCRWTSHSAVSASSPI